MPFRTMAAFPETGTELWQDFPDPHHHASQQDLCTCNALPPPRLIVAGWACRYRLHADKRRQILGFLLPGDFVGRVLLPNLPLPYAVMALAGLKTVSAQPLVEAATNLDSAALARAIRFTAHLDDLLLFNQMMRLGQQTARERVVHLMLELHERLGLVGLAWGNQFAMPLAPDLLAEALGLSVVHVNRALQQLRTDGLLDVEDGMVALLKPEQLQDLAEWTPLSLALQSDGMAAGSS